MGGLTAHLDEGNGGVMMMGATWASIALLIGILGLVLFVAAVVSIARTPHSSGIAQAVWILIVLAFPVLGPVLWFLVGKGSAAGQSTPPGVQR